MAPHCTGMVRRVDRPGRIVIPKEVRETFGRGAEPAFAVDGEAVVLAPWTLVCTFRASHDHVVAFHGQGIHMECVREARDLACGG